MNNIISRLETSPCRGKCAHADIEGALEEIERMRSLIISGVAKTEEVINENKRLREALDNITMMHDGNMSDAMAGTPEIDYARFVMGNMRKEARTALSLNGHEKPEWKYSLNNMTREDRPDD